MKTPKDFDYDIWKDDDGHYYIRVKRTGETTRVSEEVVRELWRELYRMDKYRKDTTITMRTVLSIRGFCRWTTVGQRIRSCALQRMNRGFSAKKVHLRTLSWKCWNGISSKR